MSEDRLRIGAIELRMAGGKSIIVRAIDIEHVFVDRFVSPMARQALINDARREYDLATSAYGRESARNAITAIRERGHDEFSDDVPRVDSCNVVLRSGTKYAVLNSKEELLDVIRNS